MFFLFFFCFLAEIKIHKLNIKQVKILENQNQISLRKKKLCIYKNNIPIFEIRYMISLQEIIQEASLEEIETKQL